MNRTMQTRSSIDPSGEIAYRAISVPAVAGLLLGLASGLAFLNPLLWLVPVVAAAASLYALWQVARYAPGLTGRGAATLGLGLALFFGTGAIVHAGIERLLIDREARRAGLLWMSAVRSGDLYNAHQMTQDPRARLPLHEDLAQSYSERPQLKAQFESFLDEEVVKAIRQLPADAKIEVREFGASTGNRLRQRMPIVFRVTYPPGVKPRIMMVHLVMHRVRDASTGDVAWWIVPIEALPRRDANAQQPARRA